MSGNPSRQVRGSWNNPKTCPKCKKEYFAPSALSREDNKTKICPECGVREALQVAADKYGKELV